MFRRTRTAAAPAALLVLLLGAAALATRLAGGAPDPAAIDWRTDLAAARAEAAQTGRPLLVVFR
ncbi:MAG: hypothetical protein HZA54_19930 [Planctomycetes bacterium]|nr:hypothetical protein [Planctomycetota bacterium]